MSLPTVLKDPGTTTLLVDDPAFPDEFRGWLGLSLGGIVETYPEKGLTLMPKKICHDIIAMQTRPRTPISPHLNLLEVLESQSPKTPTKPSPSTTTPKVSIMRYPWERAYASASSM